MADVQALRELHAFMCEVGATYARCGELELRFDAPLRAAPSEPVDIPQPDPRDEMRRSLGDLLHSSGADLSAVERAFDRRAG